MKYVLSPYRAKDRVQDLFSQFTAEKMTMVKKYHQTFPQYKETPLHSLSGLAEYLGVKAVYVKDESYRFDLNAFKVLGASYAIARYIAQKEAISESEISYKKLLNSNLPQTVFTTTTDGNHGRGIAWTAKLLGQKAIVNMPKGTVSQRVKAIEELGAQVNVTDMNYDETVRLTAKQAEQEGRVIVQDTAWPGYEDIPLWIMKGYGTMAAEVYEKLPEAPTHVFVQAGVGSMAAAVIAALANFYNEKPPVFILMEAESAACFYRTAQVAKETPVAAEGELATIMAGLACGEASSLAWPIIRNYVDAYFSLADVVAANGMRVLSSPKMNDPRIVSGESGAVGVGLLYALKQKPHKEIAKKIKLDQNSVVVMFSTEGATDEENYRKIVWNGKYPDCQSQE